MLVKKNVGKEQIWPWKRLLAVRFIKRCEAKLVLKLCTVNNNHLDENFSPQLMQLTKKWVISSSESGHLTMHWTWAVKRHPCRDLLPWPIMWTRDKLDYNAPEIMKKKIKPFSLACFDMCISCVPIHFLKLSTKFIFSLSCVSRIDWKLALYSKHCLLWKRTDSC